MGVWRDSLGAWRGAEFASRQRGGVAAAHAQPRAALPKPSKSSQRRVSDRHPKAAGVSQIAAGCSSAAARQQCNHVIKWPPEILAAAPPPAHSVWPPRSPRPAECAATACAATVCSNSVQQQCAATVCKTACAATVTQCTANSALQRCRQLRGTAGSAGARLAEAVIVGGGDWRRR